MSEPHEAPHDVLGMMMGDHAPYPPAAVGHVQVPVELQSYLEAVEQERWRAHDAAHQRDRDVLDKAAADVRQALDKAASEVDRRLVDILASYQSLLTSHLDLHRSDSEALILARVDVERRLLEMNQLRSQIEGERGMYVTRDMLEGKLEQMLGSIRQLEAKLDGSLVGVRTEISAQVAAARAASTLAVEKIATEQQVQNGRLGALEAKAANLDGRFAVLAGVLAIAVLVVQFIANALVRGMGG